jgi:hypothetical protein
MSSREVRVHWLDEDLNPGALYPSVYLCRLPTPSCDPDLPIQLLRLQTVEKGDTRNSDVLVETHPKSQKQAETHPKRLVCSGQEESKICLYCTGMLRCIEQDLISADGSY